MKTRVLLLALLAACGPKTTTTTVGGGGGTTGGSAGGTIGETGPANPSGARAIETPKLLAQPLPNDPMKVTIHKLSNGMTVYLAPDKEVPSFQAHVVVRAGSRHDPQQSTGLAHYLEHMVFKGSRELGTLDYAKEKPHVDRIAQLYADLRKPGTDRAKILKEIDAETQAAAQYQIPNELDQLYDQIGITGLNAFTANDATVYISNVPNNRIAQWAKVEATRYSDPVWRLFWPELEAVYEEKNRSIDNPLWRVEETFLKTLFPKHGYGWSSGIGEIEHLKSPAYQDMEAFFARYYTPQNMAIVISGDVDASILTTLEKEFGPWKKPPGPAVDPAALPQLPGRVAVDVPVPSNEGVVLGWQLVAANHPDRVALEVMDLLLLDGTSGIIQRDLLLPQKVANAGSDPELMRESGYFQLHADALAGQKHDELEKLLLALVGKLQRGEFTDTDLATAVLTREISWQMEAESNQGRVGRMHDAFINNEAWADVVARIDNMRKVTKADVMRVAKQYLNGNFVAVRKVKKDQELPKIEKPGITPVKVDPSRLSAYKKAILEIKTAPIEPVVLKEGTDYQRGKLATGPIVVAKNQRNALFTATFEFDHGSKDDKLVCLALETLPVSGAGKKTAQQVSRALHELGVRVDTVCAKDESGIVLSGIDRNFEAGMKLLEDWLASPAIDDATLKARVATTLTERANVISDPQAITFAASQFAAFGKDSEFVAVPSNKQLQAATPAQLVKSLSTFLHRKHRTSYFGPRALAAASAVAVLGDGKVAGRGKRPTKYRTANTLLITDHPMAQSHVRFYWPRKSADNAARAAGALYSEYIGPVLFQEVREARGLAYSVRGGFNPSSKKIDDAAALAYVGTQTDKTHDAIEAVLSTMKAPIDDARLKRAKDTIMENYRVGRVPPRQIPDTVYTWDDQGETTDPRAARTERALKLDKAALETWVKDALSRKVIVSVTGDRKKLDEAKLKQLAPITAAPLTQLFGY
ncbi:MAG: insulinase family protein [Kofleriaceae bacterium]